MNRTSAVILLVALLALIAAGQTETGRKLIMLLLWN